MKLIVPEEILSDLQEHLKKYSLTLNVATSGEGVVVKEATEEALLCTDKFLYRNGIIHCTVARDLAEPLGIEKKNVRIVLNFLNIKIRACELGCF